MIKDIYYTDDKKHLETRSLKISRRHADEIKQIKFIHWLLTKKLKNGFSTSILGVFTCKPNTDGEN